MRKEKVLDMFNVGNVLRNFREQKGMTQLDVVTALDISYNHYAKIEEGMRGMSLKLLFKFMDFFDTDANTILGLTEKGGI